MAILTANDISKSYIVNPVEGSKSVVLDNLNFSINEGEMVAVMGPSGSGKTTFLNLLSGIDYPDNGEIVVQGESLLDMDDDMLSRFRRKNLGMIFQDFQLLDSLNVSENILVPLVLDNVDFSEQEILLDKVLKELEIFEIKDKQLNEISGGQKQRVAIARAIINQPDLILADEPTGALDIRSTGIAMECMKDLNKRLNIALLIVTHDSYAASFCDRVVMLKGGKIFKEIKRKTNQSDLDFHNKIMDMAKELGEKNA